MFANLGFYLLFLACICCAYGFIASLVSAKWQHRRLYRSAKMSLTGAMLLTTVAAVLMWISLYNRDYSIFYVFKNSSNDLPPIFTFTAFWSSLEGSHFLWTWFMSICATIAIWTHAKDNEHIMPYVSGAMQAVLCWMFYLLVSHSDPFVQNLPAAPNGNGMNELLQNIYMAIHPPLLFAGYTTLVVPFAYAIAALCYGDITEGWVKSVRRWTLVAWVFLTVAITLGGKWAYVELGWAGYWAWDPVENSSLMPWLCATALLHSLLVQEKLGHLKRLTLILCLAGFFLTFVGTFLTRSGVVSSVHSFAESPIGPNYLAYLAGLAIIATALYAWRAPLLLPAEAEKVWGVSKESALLITQFLIISLGAIVLIGTLYPILSDALTKQRTTVQAPYFNAFAPYIGLAVMIAIAIGNLMRYQTSKMPGAKPIIVVATVASFPISAGLIYLADLSTTAHSFAYGAQIVGIYLFSWALVCLCGDLYLKLKDLRFNWQLLFQRNLAYLGAWVAHVGMLIAIFGFLGNYRGVEKRTQVKVGETISLYGYDLTLKDGIQVQKQANATLFMAPIAVKFQGRDVGELHPAQSRYPTKDQTFNEIAIKSEIWHDLYIVLSGFDRTDGKTVSLQININPTVKVVWISVVIMTLGGLIALADRYRGNRSRDVVAGRWQVGEA